MDSALSLSIHVPSLKSLGQRVIKLWTGQNLDEKFDLDLLKIGQGQKCLWNALRLSSSIYVPSLKSLGKRVIKLRPGQNLDEKFDLDL